MAGASAPETGVLMHTSDRGQSWQQSDVGMVTPIDGVWSLDREHVVAATGGGQILATDGGGTWQTTFSDPHMMLWGVWGSAGGEVYVVGGVEVSANGGAYNVPVYRGVVLHSADV